MTDELYDILIKPRQIKLRIAKLTLELEELRLSVLPEAIRYDKDRVQASPDSDQMAQYMVRLEDREREIDKLRVALECAINDISDLTDQIDTKVLDQAALIITYKWIRGLKFCDIQKEVGLSESTMFRQYNAAIEELDKLLKLDSK